MENQSPINYSIDTLPEIFEGHALESDKMLAKTITTFLESNPKEELPEWMNNPFNIARALSVMCHAIRELQVKS